MKLKKKALAGLLGITLAVGGAIGGTYAWLTAKTDDVVNTFTTSDIDITLTETTGEEYKMVPGTDLDKDPKVTVMGGSEKCYLFVKVTAANNTTTENGSFLTYKIADGWTELDGEADVYYRTVEASDKDQRFEVLDGNVVSVDGGVTKADMEVAKDAQPTITVTAYASQFVNGTGSFTASDAWKNVPKN